MLCPPSKVSVAPASRPDQAARTSSGSHVSGRRPVRPASTASGVPWPRPVEPSDPNSEHRMRRTAPRRPVARRSSANMRAARIGPTVWELEGPIPMENRSRAETYAVTVFMLRHPVPSGLIQQGPAPTGARRCWVAAHPGVSTGARMIPCTRNGPPPRRQTARHPWCGASACGSAEPSGNRTGHALPGRLD